MRSDIASSSQVLKATEDRDFITSLWSPVLVPWKEFFLIPNPKLPSCSLPYHLPVLKLLFSSLKLSLKLLKAKLRTKELDYVKVHY